MLITLEMDCRRQCNIKLLAGGAVRITAAFPWRALASNRWRTRQRLISVYLSASLEALLARVCTTTCSVFTQHINNVTPVTQDHFHSINASQDHQIQCNTTQYPETSSRVPQPNPRKMTPNDPVYKTPTITTQRIYPLKPKSLASPSFSPQLRYVTRLTTRRN